MTVVRSFSANIDRLCCPTGLLPARTYLPERFGFGCPRATRCSPGPTGSLVGCSGGLLIGETGLGGWIGSVGRFMFDPKALSVFGIAAFV